MRADKPSKKHENVVPKVKATVNSERAVTTLSEQAENIPAEMKPPKQ